MTDAIRHRGPDDAGHTFDAAHGIALGHRRLSIVDLSPLGHQPMHSPSGRYTLIFNGEVYNHHALRAELAAEGVPFRGRSDTEVLLALIERGGLEAALARCVGMFAIGLWDTARGTLQLARDRFGEKPLYWGRQAAGFGFASELKALRMVPGFRGDIDPGALSLFLRHGYVPAPYAIHHGVEKVEPGTVLTFTAPDAEPSLTRYWSNETAASSGTACPLALTDVEAADAVEAALRRSIRDQLVADVPLGGFLSGGIDSSLVVALMQAESTRRVRTFTIGFREAGYDEAPHAAAVAQHLGTDHTTLYVTAADALAVIPQLPAIYDEPFADSSQIPTVLLAALARQHVTVALSGDGSDELFGGYSRYALGERAWRRLRRVPPTVRRAAAYLVSSVPRRQWDTALRATGLYARGVTGDRLHRLARFADAHTVKYFYRDLVSSWHSPAQMVREGVEPPTAMMRSLTLRNGSLLADMMLRDQLSYLPDDILVKVDRATMAASLESRAPFLDHRVAELAWQLEPSQWRRDGVGKWVLRRVLDRHVPRALVDRPKQGFGVPMAAWLRGPLRDWVDDLLAPAALARDGLLDPAPIVARWREHRAGVRDWSPGLWFALMFQAWRAENP